MCEPYSPETVDRLARALLRGSNGVARDALAACDLAQTCVREPNLWSHVRARIEKVVAEGAADA